MFFFIFVAVTSFGALKKSDNQSQAAGPGIYDISVWKTIKPGIHSGFGSTDIAYPKNIPPTGKLTETINLQGWRGERVNCLLLVWSSGMKDEIRIKASKFHKEKYQLEKAIISISIVDHVLSNEFAGGCGTRDLDKSPVNTSPDLLTKKKQL